MTLCIEGTWHYSFILNPAKEILHQQIYTSKINQMKRIWLLQK